MKKFLLSAIMMTVIAVVVNLPQTAIAQVFGEFNSITLVENKPYDEFSDGTLIPASAFSLGPNFNETNKKDGYYRVNLGFDFEFNGEIFNQAWISVNGYITLSPPPFLPSPNPQALFLDANSYPTNVIAPFWGDHYYRDETDFFTNGYVVSGISYKTISEFDEDGKERKVFIVQWKDLNINYILDGNPVKSSVGNFQVRLYESYDEYSKQGDIEFAYGSIGPRNRPDITDTRVITRGAVAGIKGEGKIVGEGADFLNGLFFDKDLQLASTRTDVTQNWQPSTGSDKRILFTASIRFNVAEWWGDGDVDFSKAVGNKHYNMPQSRFVTVNDVRLIMKSVATGIPLDPVRRRAAYHADVNHNGRYYYNTSGDKVNITRRSKVFTDDLPNEISSIKQVLFEANEYDAAWILRYIGARIVELPWLIDTSVNYGKLAAEEHANHIKLGNITNLGNGTIQVPVYLNGALNNALGIKFNVNAEILDVIKYETEASNIMVMSNANTVVISGDGKFSNTDPVVILTLRLNDAALNLTNIRFNDNVVGDLSLVVNKVETSDATVLTLSNTPNPFAENTLINVNIAQSGNYSLNVYDLQGNLVKEIFNADLTADVHSYLWNGSDINGNSVANGVYIYKLRGNGINVSETMILNR